VEKCSCQHCEARYCGKAVSLYEDIRLPLISVSDLNLDIKEFGNVFLSFYLRVN
jgi:hypothetical protein